MKPPITRSGCRSQNLLQAIWGESGKRSALNRLLFAAVPLMAALSVPVAGFCSSVITGHVKNFGTYGNGNVFVELDTKIDEPGCVGPYMELQANGAANKVVLATAALSVATGAAVTVKTDGCLGPATTFTGARAAFIGVNKP